ncbi:Translation initiation factor IF-2, N-terminal region [Rhizoctonia solani]|uniref:1-phosphatidylinositol-3-phosphate 5-kinase n=1 Tax=Rhizoctonia solani TaxID=456999 RepID=A0A8H7HE22_9AGAM|nr:Translation initiation factor IF-2, N-terminal region [Rhizoctonia solani]
MRTILVRHIGFLAEISRDSLLKKVSDHLCHLFVATTPQSEDHHLLARCSIRATMDSPVTLTTHNPFEDDDLGGQGGYALVTSIFSKMKNTFVATGPSGATTTSVPTPSVIVPTTGENTNKPANKAVNKVTSPTNPPSPVRAPSLKPATKSLKPGGSNPAPPLVSFAPIAVEQPRYIAEGASIAPQTYEGVEGIYGTSIPGFAIPDDARSVRTVASTKRGASISKVIRRLRGEETTGWMMNIARSVTTARACSQLGDVNITVGCAANIISSTRFGQEGMIRVCNLCLQVLEDEGLDDDDDRRSVTSAATSAPVYHPFHYHQRSMSLSQSYQPPSPFSATGPRRTDEPFPLFSRGDLSLRHRLQYRAHDSDDSRPQTPTEILFSPEPAPAPAPFRRGANDDELEVGEEGMGEKEMELYLERTSRNSSNGARRNVAVGEGKGGKAFAFPGPTSGVVDSPGALQLETGAAVMDQTAAIIPNAAASTPGLSALNQTAPTNTSTPNTESSILFPASASSPETPAGLVPIPGIGPRRDSASAFGRERPRLGSGDRLRLNSFGNRLESFTGGRMDSFHSSHAGDRTPYLRSRVHSRLGEFSPISAEGDLGWRTRRESSAYAAELNAVSMFHLRIMIRQLLSRAQINQPKEGTFTHSGANNEEANENAGQKGGKSSIPEKGATSEWEDTLLRLSLKLASRLNVASTSGGANVDMDVRHFVKIKKIPGGRPRDSEYVDGAVISSNLAHKKMKRDLPLPRIMILAFSLEWQRRENEYLTLDSILAQEREYLRNLVARITALRPRLVLVERTVSRLALEYLMAANVAVARAVPPRSTKFVSRMTGAEVVPDIPALHRGPRLGECARFKIQTYDHHLIPGRRKSYMRFEGCDSHRSGCTIILRGADLDTLKKLKEVMRFIAFIVRNLKMESFLWKDCVVTMPGVTGEAVPTPTTGNSLSGIPTNGGDVSVLMRPRAKSFPGLSAKVANDPSSESGVGVTRWISPVLPEPSPVFEDDDTFSTDDEAEDEAVILSRQINASLRPYLTTFISVSATLRFFPPWPVRMMKEADDQLRSIKREWGEEQRQKEREKVTKSEEHLPQNANSEYQVDKESTPSVIVVGPADEPSGPRLHPSASLSSLRSTVSVSSINLPAVPSRIPTPAPSPLAPGPAISAPELRSPSELDVEARLADAKERHDVMRREWEWYLRRNRDDFAVEKYQQIALRSFVIPTASGSSSMTGSANLGQMENSHRPCFRPELVYKYYYGEGDQSLAHFIEETCSIPANSVCEAKDCNVLRIAHTQVFVHNESQVLISTEPWTGRIGAKQFNAPLYEGITTWSICRVCMQSTPLIPLSEEAGRYSFAKFLELHFYPADVLLMHGAGCSHNIYQHHIRYFHWHGMTVRFQTEKVTLHELVFPPTHIRVRPQALLSFKNDDYIQMLRRNTAYWDSVLSRIQVAADAAAQLAQLHPEQAQNISTLAGEMRERSVLQRNHIEQLIYKEYEESSTTDTLQLGRVRPIWQRIITQFDDEFGQLERLYLPNGYYVGTEKDFRRSVAQNKISKYVPEIMGSVFSTMDRKVISRFVDPERRQTGSKRESGQLVSSASEYESNVDSCAEPPNSETDVRPSSIDLPSPAEISGQDLDQPPAVATGNISVEALPIDEITVDAQVLESQHGESEGGDSDSTISAPQTRPEISLENSGIQPKIRADDQGPMPAPATIPGNPIVDTDNLGKDGGQSIASSVQTESPLQERHDAAAETKDAFPSEYSQRVSRLPRRTRPQPSVSDLVRQFQAVLPENFATGAFGYGPLARTSFMSDSEHDSEAQPRRVRGRPKVPVSKSKFQPRSRTFGSDFERSYAVNVAPRQTQSTVEAGPSRIPAPVQPVTLPLAETIQSGRSSPTHSMLDLPRRPMLSRTTTGSTIKNTNAATLEPLTATRKVSPNLNKSAKGKALARNPPRDPSTVRNTTSSISSRQGTRRITGSTINNTGSKVATQIRQFERLSKENEKANRRYAIIRGRRARPVATAKPKVEIFNNYEDALRDDESESGDSSSEADDEDEGEEDPNKLRVDTLDPILSVSDLTAHSMTLPAPATRDKDQDQQIIDINDSGKRNEHTETKLQVHPNHILDFTPESSLPSSPLIRPRDSGLGQGNYSEAEMSASADRRSFLYRMSSALSRIQAREYAAMNLSYPAAPTDHVFAESYITVREDEPTSIIALTLSAHDYRINMARALSSKHNKLAEKPEVFMPDNLSVGEAPSTWGIISHDDLPDPADVLKHPQTVSHQTYSYQSGDVTVTCKVLYAEQFQALRRSCDCDQIMIESLARCIKWDAAGGKSGSAFLRTRDERFIAKELSRQEADDMGKFAPKYFDYMSSALSEGRPSVLAKLFGFYQISLKNPMAGKSVKMNLLVMENLLYDRKFAHVYDLKGLTRGRKVRKTGRENEVLLDENLVQASLTEPYYLREHAKRILRTAIWNDTQFLEDANVMDYSMVVGVDNTKNQLVIGIVDFIRTYTWDKKFENLMKEKVLGGTNKGEGPTIVIPKQYGVRFRAAMEQYFPLLPDRWMKIRDSPETQETDKSIQRS